MSESALVPCLHYDDVPAALAWLAQTFGFVERGRRTVDGQVIYAEAERAGQVIALVNDVPAGSDDAAPGPVRLRLVTPDIDAVYHRARRSGGTVVTALTGGGVEPHTFTVDDPGGHRWTLVQAPASAGGDTDSSLGARLGRLTDLLTPFAIRAAVSVRAADLIESGICELGAMAQASGTNRDALGRLLRYLAYREVFTEPEPDVFALTDLGQMLVDRSVVGRGAWLDMDGPGVRMDMSYTGMLHSIRTGEPSYAVVHGHSFWADLDSDPDRQAFFDQLMMAGHKRVGPQVATLYDWSGVKHVIDVGGGSGALLAELLHTHAHLRGTLVDRPDPARITGERFAGGDLADRMEVVAGDFFGELPTGGDVYVISRALTDWGDREAATVLRRCGEAAGPHGRVLIVEVLPSEPFVPFQSDFDLQMLVVVGGRERSVADFATLAAGVGLAVTQVIRGRDGLALIECAIA